MARANWYVEHFVFSRLAAVDDWLHDHSMDGSYLASVFCQWSQRRLFELEDEVGLYDAEPLISVEFVYDDGDQSLYSVKEHRDIPRSDSRWLHKWQENATYGSVFLLTEFIELCKTGCFIDYDGSGHLSNGSMMDTGYNVYPSELLKGNYDHSMSHIVWFNK